MPLREGYQGLDNQLSMTLAEELFQRVAGPFTMELHPKQEAFVNTDARHAAFIGGIGSGKSWGGCVRALRAAQGWIGNRRIAAPNLGIVTAPTYPMLRDATLRTFEDIAREYVVSFNRSDGLMMLRNGSEILFRSTEHPDRLRGPSISWWFGDEAALYRSNVRSIMLGRLRQFGQQGYAWITTTPKGRNWVWQVYVRDGGEDYCVMTATSRENTFLGDEVLEMWEREYQGDFALQELEGAFVAFEGLVYSEFSRERHVTRERPAQFQQVIAGVDWGFANPGAIMVCGIDGDGRMMVISESYARQRRVEEWVNVARQLRDTWGIERFLCDPSEPDYIRQFREAGLKAEGADNSVLPGIQHVKNRLAVQGDGRTRLMIDADAVNTIAEFEQYQWAENRHGMRDAPVKANDHALDALRYAVRGVDHQRIRPLVAEAKKYA